MHGCWAGVGSIGIGNEIVSSESVRVEHGGDNFLKDDWAWGGGAEGRIINLVEF